MSEHMSPIPSRLYNAAVGGHVAGADQIIDDETGLTLDKVAGGALEEKEYTSGSNNGMGRVVLRKNLVNGVNTLTQSMINKSNTIYVIQYDFTLGENITVPANCVLEFDGGSISGAYTITGANTGIQAGLVKIFNTDITLAGIWNVSEAYPEWFGAKGDEVTDDTIAIQMCVDSFMNTILNGNSYLVSTIYLRPKSRTVGKKIINKSLILSKGNGIWVGSQCTLIGGRISGNTGIENTSCITLGVNDDATIAAGGNATNITIKDVWVHGAKYGINCYELDSDKWNAFCVIDSVSIMSCDYAFYGNIRSSYINLTLRGNYGNFYGTNCHFNDIHITGNASSIASATDRTHYEAFIHIQGSRNKVSSFVYDIGANRNVQQRLVDFLGAYNTINDNAGYIQPTNPSNSQTKYLYLDGSYVVLNPKYSVSLVNVSCTTGHENALKESLFRDGKMYSYLSLTPTDDTQPAYVEFQFGQINGFSGINFAFVSGQYVFSKIEAYANNTDSTPIASIDQSPEAYTSLIASNYDEFGGYNFNAIPNLTIRCYLTGNVRLIGARLFALNTSENPKNVGSWADRPQYYYTIKTGYMYVVDTGSALIPIWARISGTSLKWYKADGTEYTG